MTGEWVEVRAGSRTNLRPEKPPKGATPKDYTYSQALTDARKEITPPGTMAAPGERAAHDAAIKKRAKELQAERNQGAAAGGGKYDAIYDALLKEAKR